MRLDQLLDGVAVRDVLGDPSVPVTMVTFDSRTARPGALHCCLPGSRQDGHRFAAEAVAAGATSLLLQHDVDLPVTQVLVNDPRAAMAQVSAALYGHPSRALAVIGVTGTASARLGWRCRAAETWAMAARGSSTRTRVTGRSTSCWSRRLVAPAATASAAKRWPS